MHKLLNYKDFRPGAARVDAAAILREWHDTFHADLEMTVIAGNLTAENGFWPQNSGEITCLNACFGVASHDE
jgi:hypothetical protein